VRDKPSRPPSGVEGHFRRERGDLKKGAYYWEISNGARSVAGRSAGGARSLISQKERDARMKETCQDRYAAGEAASSAFAKHEREKEEEGLAPC